MSKGMKQMEVAFASWELGLIQACLAKASTMKEAMGDPKVTNLETMKDMLEDVPEEVLLAAGLANFKDIAELTEMPDKDHVKMVVENIVGLCEEAEIFYADQQNALGNEAGAAASGV